MLAANAKILQIRGTFGWNALEYLELLIRVRVVLVHNGLLVVVVSTIVIGNC